MDVLVAGGTGFVGRPLCRVLDERGHDVTAVSRSPDVAELPSGVETAAADVSSGGLTGIVDGHDVVVNLVALPSHYQHRRRSHESVHLDGTRHLVRASQETGVERFVQMSGLGVETDVQTEYFRAKRRAENVVQNSELEWVLFRPSVVFGDGCAFLPFIERVTLPLVTPLPGGRTMRLQPIWVEDLAPMLADGVEDARHARRTYEIGGPERLTLETTVELIRDSSVVPIPLSLAAAAFSVADVVPGVPFGRDQYRVLRLDNTTADNGVTAFGASENDLRTLGAYLDGNAPEPNRE